MDALPETKVCVGKTASRDIEAGEILRTSDLTQE